MVITGEIGVGQDPPRPDAAPHPRRRGLRGGRGRQPARGPPRPCCRRRCRRWAPSRPAGSTARLAGRVRARLAESAGAGAPDGPRRSTRPSASTRAALDEVRLLTNPGDGPSAPVVLLGQPELTRHIERLPQVSQRVVVRYHLGPMTADEVDLYVAHRTRVAGADRRILSKRAARAVHDETGGVPAAGQPAGRERPLRGRRARRGPDRRGHDPRPGRGPPPQRGGRRRRGARRLVRRVSYQSMLGRPGRRRRRRGLRAPGRHRDLHAAQGRAPRRHRRRSPSPRCAGCARPSALSGSGIDEGADPARAGRPRHGARARLGGARERQVPAPGGARVGHGAPPDRGLARGEGLGGAGADRATPASAMRPDA